ncbi:hypothetical protein VTJ04DRAFT_2956 [Mycothermus thermophilus]|uniref:uncharacterized protein n=1 Tax=Humicola insolens TaxID=85995 RepID=UPI003742C5C5
MCNTTERQRRKNNLRIVSSRFPMPHFCPFTPSIMKKKSPPKICLPAPSSPVISHPVMPRGLPVQPRDQSHAVVGERRGASQSSLREIRKPAPAC